jgi:CheY-like chemotaxis protein
MRLLCIDDEPIRFAKLASFADCFVTDRPEVVSFYLKAYDFDAVLLDHDMPLWTGVEVARNHLIWRGIPVVVHSANEDGAKAIMRLLEEYAVPCYRLNVLSVNWETRLSSVVHKLVSIRGKGWQ